MPFDGLPRAILEAVPKTPKGEDGRHGDALVRTMVEAGEPEPDYAVFVETMFLLRDEGYLKWNRTGGGMFDGFFAIRLVGAGLELVDSWPRRTLPTLDDQAVQALLEAIGELANRADLSEDEREAATTIKEAGQTVGYNLLSSVLVIWLQARGLLPSG